MLQVCAPAVWASLRTAFRKCRSYARRPDGGADEIFMDDVTNQLTDWDFHPSHSWNFHFQLPQFTAKPLAIHKFIPPSSYTSIRVTLLPHVCRFCPPHTFTCPLFCVRLSSVCFHVSVFCMFRGSVSDDNLLGSEVHYCLAATRKKSELPRLRPTTFRAQVPNWHLQTWWQSFHFFPYLNNLPIRFRWEVKTNASNWLQTPFWPWCIRLAYFPKL